MGKFNSIEEIDCWKEGIQLVKHVYRLKQNNTRLQKDFSFVDQIQRAAISIPSNIAEGFERQSNPEFIRFLFIAKGSCGEVRTQLYIGFELGYIIKPDFEDLDLLCRKISKMLMGLIIVLRNVKPLNIKTL